MDIKQVTGGSAGFGSALSGGSADTTLNDEEEMIVANTTRQIFHHYTDEEGHQAIEAANMILPNSRGKVFVTPLVLNPLQAFYKIFIGAPTHAGRGNFVISFSPRQGVDFAPGKNGDEFLYSGTLRFDRQVDVVYSGPNLNE
jgi:hypothetical protein